MIFIHLYFKHLANSLVVIAFLFQSFHIFAQDKEFASRIISDLTAKDFHGRGYTHKGINKAEKYIVTTLKNIGIKNIVVQTFKMPVSVIKSAKVLFDTTFVKWGDNAIVYPSSASLKGMFEIEKINKSNLADILTKDLTNKFVLFDTSLTSQSKYSSEIHKLLQNNSVKAKGFILCKKTKLMQVQANKKNNWVIIEVDTSFINARNITINLKTKYIKQYKTSNIIATIKGKSDSIIAFSAHYDHLGELENIYFPGANDNASGVSMVIDIGRELANEQNSKTIALLFFTGEEVGLIGSNYFVGKPTFDLKKIKYLFNLDVIGSGEKGITIVNGKIYQSLADELSKINIDKNLNLDIQIREASNNSDHAPFYMNGIPSVFIYAKGKTGPYHHPDDNLLNLSLAKYNDIVKLLLTYTKQ
ncbi:MAG: M20/M25/M40 family metallo-hydrolase [Bacteroidales bacterium]|nr:M20/M25/M40 family metallo-hydrolase [Bacteroidales bacterium]